VSQHSVPEPQVTGAVIALAALQVVGSNAALMTCELGAYAGTMKNVDAVTVEVVTDCAN
jgi:hypothetical protein